MHGERIAYLEDHELMIHRNPLEAVSAIAARDRGSSVVRMMVVRQAPSNYWGGVEWGIHIIMGSLIIK